VRDDNGGNPANSELQFFEAATDKIWAQAGIDILFLDAKTLNNSSLQQVDGIDIFKPSSSGKMASSDPMVLNMWFVKEITGGIFGETFTANFANLPFNDELVGLSVIADNIFAENNSSNKDRIDTIGHEIGHALGLPASHINGQTGQDNPPTNLMAFGLTDGSGRIVPNSLDDISPMGNGYDTLTQDQIALVMNSQLVTAIPIPAAWLLFATGSLLMGGIATRRSKK
jgi:hypothetical protein